MSTLLGLVHGLDYLLSSWLVGSILFSAGIESAAGHAAERRFARSRTLCIGLASAVLLVSLAWFALVGHEMAESWSPSELLAVATGTNFGHASEYKVALALILLVLTFAKRLPRFWWLALALPVCFSLSGHAAAERSSLVTSVTIDTVHLLAVAVWTGGLASLSLWLKDRLQGRDASPAPNPSITVVTRFSRFAMTSTALIAFTGVAMALRSGVSLTSPWASDYGTLVLAKIGLFTLALGAASLNQFVHMRGWTAEREPQFTRSVHREVRFELAAVVLIFFVAGFLARTPPPGH